MKDKLSKYFKTSTGKYIISILLGLGLASIFREICKDKECIIYTAPNLNEVENKIYKQDGKCYKYTLVSTTCDKNKKEIPIHYNAS